MENEYGICYLPYASLRSEPSHPSEQVSQLLFGEAYTVLERSDDGKWLKVDSAYDNYQGWLNMFQHFGCSASDYAQWNDESPLYISSPTEVSLNEQQLTLPIGSRLPLHQRSTLRFGNDTNKGELLHPIQEEKDILKIARAYLGTPYLWGGRSIASIDCSGFSQQICKHFGIDLPRDAYQQVELGTEVAPPEMKAGDLAFFPNEKGRIIHVGLITSPERITHANGYVREDRFDGKSIWAEREQTFSHQNGIIKRML